MDALASVFVQSFSDFEIIVVDDKSSDDTRIQLAIIADQRLIVLENKDAERSAARNTGIENAKGRYICFLDDDDKYDEDYLNDFYHRLKSLNFPTDTILRTSFYKCYEDGKIEQGVQYQETIHKNPVRFAAYHMCGVWSLCIPYQCLRDNKFDERFPHWQDTHLILRLFGKYEMIQIEKYNYCYRIHKEMGSQKNLDPQLIMAKAQINVAAIEDFFEKYSGVANKYLPPNTKAYLLSEKYAQYALRALRMDKERGLQLMSKSKQSGFFIHLWKYYILFLFYYLRP